MIYNGDIDSLADNMIVFSSIDNMKELFMRFSRKYKRLFQIALLIICGWFGEFSYIVSLIRSVDYILRSGYLSASPIMSEFNWMYGLSWRVSFSVGAPTGLNLIGFALLVLIIWIFIEFYKVKI